ncbi:MBL fold metallo-hydrolase [Haloarchaeobius sp. DFWS5]|uniref:MBL fold metallo-hydrolase n=1 Tax=Haloarchaeobius sp. DFWS5 TaxID=3446114 RepID=UPI003EBF7EFE
MDRISLDSPEFEGDNSVYLLQTETSTVLVDTGVSSADCWHQLRDGLQSFGFAPADLDAVLVTHWHYDHAGLAARLQEVSDATVYAHELDVPLVERDPGAVQQFRDRHESFVAACGVPARERESLFETIDGGYALAGDSAAVTPLEDGAVLSFDDCDLEVFHTPGHTLGHIGFAFEGDHGPEAFLGDALLPVYTPNVGGADLRVDDPLARYVDSLERIADRNFDTVWPGHREAIHDPAARAHDILDHHRERSERVVEVLDDRGPSSVWAVASALFGSLENEHVLHGVGEAHAHLAHLADHGVLQRDGDEFSVADEDAHASEFI